MFSYYFTAISSSDYTPSDDWMMAVNDELEKTWKQASMT
jgi:hypothetical protein